MFLVASPESDDLHVRVLDSARKDAVIGYAVVRVSDVIKMAGMDMPTQPFHLQGGGPSSTISLALQVRSLMAPRKKAAPLSKQASAESVKGGGSTPQAKAPETPKTEAGGDARPKEVTFLLLRQVVPACVPCLTRLLRPYHP